MNDELEAQNLARLAEWDRLRSVGCAYMDEQDLNSLSRLADHYRRIGTAKRLTEREAQNTGLHECLVALSRLADQSARIDVLERDLNARLGALERALEARHSEAMRASDLWSQRLRRALYPEEQRGGQETEEDWNNRCKALFPLNKP